jgi:glycosyltransferase involved in cell wall biosynthesis
VIIAEQITIVIPCKNEIGYLPIMLQLVAQQSGIEGTRIIIADAHSTDGTREYIQQAKVDYAEELRIEMINGGKVSAARNAGLQLVTTPLVLFLDADSMLTNEKQIEHCLKKFTDKQLDLMGAPVRGKEPYTLYGLIFFLFNIANRLLRIVMPFAVGNFFLTRTDMTKQLGGFDEQAIHGEDYLLSMKYSPSKFGFSPYAILQDSRRFKKTGHFKFVAISILSFLMSWNRKFFYRDVGYWGK